MNTITENHRHRRSIRLPEYDYSSEGLYFITICVHERRSLFGTIVDGVMHLNAAGRMVEDEYHRLPDKYPHITCHEYIVMPNHFHCIIQIHPQPSTVGASLVGAQSHPQPSTVRASLVGAPNSSTLSILKSSTSTVFRAPTRDAPTMKCFILGDIVGAFKSMTTNAYIRGVKQYGWPSFNARLWQRNYYEHIIRDQRAYEKIAEYIIENPMRWTDDVLHTP